MTAKRHHYVPRCYLKNFAVIRKKGRYQVQVFDRTSGKAFAAAIENVAVEKDFNRIEIEGIQPDTFESAMSKIEGEVAPALCRTIEAATFCSDDDRALILNLVGLLALRNPRWRESVRDFHERVAKAIMDISLSSKERWETEHRKAKEAGYLDSDPKVTYEEMKKFVDDGQFKVTVPTERHIELEMGGLEAVLPHLFERKWIFLKASKDSGGFITCDHPVRLIWSNRGMRNGFYGPGFGLRGTEVIFVLSSSVAIVGAFELSDGSRQVSDDFVAGINGHMIGAALRQVYARDMNFRYELLREEGIRKASKLTSDKRFIRKRQEEDGEPSSPAHTA